MSNTKSKDEKEMQKLQTGLSLALNNVNSEEREFREKHVSLGNQPVQHKLPENHCMTLSCIFREDSKLTSEENQAAFEKAVINFETKCEKSIIETLARLDIKAMVNTDRYSLPYKEEVVVTLNGESYLNGAFEFFKVVRKIAKELLVNNVHSIRFYIYVVPMPGNMGFGKVEYRFRYSEKIYNF